MDHQKVADTVKIAVQSAIPGRRLMGQQIVYRMYQDPIVTLQLTVKRYLIPGIFEPLHVQDIIVSGADLSGQCQQPSTVTHQGLCPSLSASIQLILPLHTFQWPGRAFAAENRDLFLCAQRPAQFQRIHTAGQEMLYHQDFHSILLPNSQNTP